jgi:hypothetical protein
MEKIKSIEAESPEPQQSPELTHEATQMAVCEEIIRENLLKLGPHDGFEERNPDLEELMLNKLPKLAADLKDEWPKPDGRGDFQRLAMGYIKAREAFNAIGQTEAGAALWTLGLALKEQEQLGQI